LAASSEKADHQAADGLEVFDTAAAAVASFSK
jgi:hypothetical protein